jgi:DnaJ-class molecular chaperone
MDSSKAASILGVKLPTTMNVVKTAFRRMSRLEHPDVSKHQKAHERFLQIQEAYACLQKVAAEDTVIEKVTENDKTEEGILLKDLGLGLGPTTNGRPCGDCGGKGFTSYSCEKEVCPDCRRVNVMVFSFWFDPTGIFEYRCRKCKGTGSFSKGEKVIGTCFNCNGKGWHRVNRRDRNNCQTCKGRMEIDNPNGAKKHLRCTTCKGTGEILVFNPVLPKGLLAMNGAK